VHPWHSSAAQQSLISMFQWMDLPSQGPVSFLR
jgi:hypothetical protein